MQRPNRLKEVRKQRGMTALELAEKVGVRDITIYRYESGDREPPLPTMYRLADALGVTLDDIFPMPQEEATV